MRIILTILISFLFLACGNQEYGKSDIRLLNTKETNTSKKEIISKERNQTENIVIKNDLNESKDIQKKEEIVKEESNESQNIHKEEILTVREESNESIVVPVVDRNITNINLKDVKSEKLQLAELEAKIKSETLALEKELSIIKMSNSHEIALAEIKSKENLSKNQKELDRAKSIDEKEIRLSKLQAEKERLKTEEKIAINKALNDKEIALAKLENQKELTDKNIAFYKIIASLVAVLLFFIVMIIYFINRRKRKNELKLHEDELRHKEYMEASRQHNEHIGKMLDIITDENADKGVKKEIVRLLKEQGKKGNLIEYKK